MKKLLMFSLALFVFGCGGVNPPPVPQPTPIPSPTPTPPPVSGLPVPTLLHVKAGTNQFTNAEGKRVWLLGYGGVCCHADNAVNGWTQISEPWLQELAAHGGDFVHVRTGPYSKALEPRPERRPYNDDGTWNPAYFAQLNALIDLAYSLGVYVEVDLIDGWALKNPANNWWHVTCSILQTAPQPTYQRYVNKIVSMIGQHPNILWQIGNETGVCGTTLDWELGIVDAVHIQETTSHFPRHIMATNGGIAKVDRHGDIDYVNSHQCEAPEQPGYTPKPIVTNECNPESFANFKTQRTISDQRGTYYHLWISDMSEADRQSSLNLIAAYRKAHP